MSAFLLLLVKVNLAMSAAVVLVALLRRPLRAQFGALVAYAIWLLVPVAGLACLLPPRVVVLPPAPIMHMAAPASVVRHVAHSPLRLGELAGQGRFVPMTPPAAIHWDPLLFAVWLLGALFMTWHLARLQFRFHAAARAGQAGPAVLGFIRPRIVTPAGFENHFTAPEQAAILAHEQVHLGRQDARINALAALLRCLNWFNPLIHLGARWLRIDQELACDARVVQGAVSRRDYASALLKSQLVMASLPLGCNWPGSEHPLIERIALLKRRSPGTVRRVGGASFVLLAATFAGLGAWAAQPPVEKHAATLFVATAQATAPEQTSVKTAARQPGTSGALAGASNVERPARAERVAVLEPPRKVRIGATTQSALGALPQLNSIAELPKAAIGDQSTKPLLAPEVTLSKERVASLAPAAAVVSSAASGPDATFATLQCQLGFGSTTCVKYDCNGGDGPVERVEYLGANATGRDIYEVHYQHRNLAYVVAPNPYRTPRQYVMQAADPYWVKRTVTSSAPARLMYTRPENSPVISPCANFDQMVR